MGSPLGTAEHESRARRRATMNAASVAHRRRAAPTRRLRAILLAASLSPVLLLAMPTPVAACSCFVPEQPMREAAADPQAVVFTGVAGPLGPDGVAVQLTRWFQGDQPPLGVAVLDPAGFEDPMGGSCGTNPPDPGAEWIIVSALNEKGRYGMSLCTTAASLATVPGQQLLADAIAVFGEAAAPEGGPPAAADPWTTIGSVAPLGIGILVFLLAGVGVLALAARRED